MRVYVAAPSELRVQAQLLMTLLTAAGIGCTSRWLTFDESPTDADWARRDLADVARADIVVALNPPDWSASGTGGRHVEVGYALALRKPVVLVGARSNIFHHLPDVTLLDDPTAVVGHVQQLGAQVLG